MYDLQSLRPARLPGKVRLGRARDGGYVLLNDQVLRTDHLLSFGVAVDWSFERDFQARRPDLTVRMFDASVSWPRIALRCIGKMMKLDFSRAGEYARAAADYVSFIALNPRVSFHRLFLGTGDRGPYLTFDSAMRMLPKPAESSVFVKLDIEGAEYDVLPDLGRHEAAINGIAVEFHELDARGGTMEAVVGALKPHFVVAHVHGNNYAPLIPGTGLPTSLEVTFANRRLAGDLPAPDTEAYPLPGLDVPNDPSRPDYPLNFQAARA